MLVSEYVPMCKLDIFTKTLGAKKLCRYRTKYIQTVFTLNIHYLQLHTAYMCMSASMQCIAALSSIYFFTEC